MKALRLSPVWRRRARLGAGLVAGVAALAVLAAGGVAAALWATLPPDDQTVAIPGLSAPVSITIDAGGVPRITAANEVDGAAALGFVHARDRMFQMDLTRRAAAGRLAELAGTAALPLDEMARTLGEQRHAEAAYAALPPGPKAMLVAYARGVNAWIGARGRFASPEFLWLGAPAPWRPSDSMLWGETVGMWLSDNWRTEIARLGLLQRDGKRGMMAARALQLWPPEPQTRPSQAWRLPSSLLPRSLLPGSLLPGSLLPGSLLPGSLLTGGMRRWRDLLPRFPARFTEPSEASDEWAVDGAHSATGKPLLAGDPHLALGFPCLWYLARIDTPDGVLAGATAPGVPFLIIGHNARIAWTFTSNGADVQDVFAEKLLADGGYATPDGERRFAERIETIHVRGAADVQWRVRQSRHGPVISDLLARAPEDPVAAPDGMVLAVSMGNLQPGSGVPGLYALNHAADVDAAGRAAAAIATPVQNLLVADARRIAMFTTGRVPVRAAGDGSMPVAGADAAHDWVGFATGAQLPHVVGPASGRLVNGNERTAPPEFPVFMGRDWQPDWRARRIRALLDQGGRATVQGFAAMQADAGSSFAQAMLPILRAAPRPRGLPATAAALLDGWDGTMRDDAPQPAIFNAWVQRFVQIVLNGAQVPEADAGPWTAFADWLLHDPDGEWWCGGPCTTLLREALIEGVSDLEAAQGGEPASWRWGRAHQAVFRDPLAGSLGPFAGFAERRIAVPGDDTTLFRGGSGTLGDFAARHGAGYRGVYDLADLDRSRFIVVPGQSGNVLSRHAWDLMKPWAAGATVLLGKTPDHVEATVRLTP